MDEKDTDMEFGAVLIRAMGHEKDDIKRLETFKMWTWRRMEKSAGWNI